MPRLSRYDASAYPLLGSGLIELDESTESQQSLNVVQLDANDSRDGEPSPAGVSLVPCREG